MKVPENRRKKSDRTIELGLRQLGREGAPVLFHLTGGPGTSNLVQKYPRGLLERFRIVEVGYRGIDSTPALDGRLLSRVLARPHLSSPESKAALVDAFGRSLERWRADGIDPSAYQMQDLVGDLEDARKMLGLERVHVMGQSYGTRVALHWMTAHPESIDRCVLVGANPPGCFFWPASGVRDVFKAWGEDAEERVAARIESLPDWIDRDRVRILTFFLLFHKSTALRVFAKHWTVTYALASLAMRLLFPRLLQWGDFFLKGLLADWDPDRDYASEVKGRFGSPLGDLLFTPRWDLSTLERDPPIDPAIRTPTLILSGALDFSTPPKNARVLAEKFPCIEQRIDPDKGHVMDFWRDPVFPEIVDRFLNQKPIAIEAPAMP